MSQRTPRVAALAAAAALALSTLVVAGAPAQAHTSADRAVEAGADWLNGQLTNGLVMSQYTDEGGNTVSFLDHGLTADFAFALDAVDATGSRDPEVRAIADALAPEVQGWYDAWGTVYTGSAAKAAVLAGVAALNPHEFGGHDLPALVESNVATEAPIVGRVQNVNELDYTTEPPSPTDSLNVISQGWASRALTEMQTGLADEVEAFLLEQQCDAGYFRYGLTPDKTAAEQGCVDGVDTPHMDTTALTVINLLEATRNRSAAVETAVDDAVAWLGTQQAADGSFSAGGTEGTNANTTGLVAWALAEAGDTARATKAASWLRRLQVADLAPCATTLSGDNGAVAFNGDALTQSRNAGSIDLLRDQYRRTTAQALPALMHAPGFNGPLGVAVPTTATEKSEVTVTVSGLGDGEAGCVTLGGVAKPVTGTGSEVTVAFDLPAGAATHAVEVTTIDGSSATASITTTLTPATTPPTTLPTNPPVVEHSAGHLKVKKVVKVHKFRFHLKVACESTTACEGRITVRSTKALKHAPGQKARKRVVATRTYSVAPGKTKKVTLKVRKGVRRVLAKGKVRVKAVQTVDGARRTITKFWLKKKR